MAVHGSPHAALDFSDLDKMDLSEEVKDRIKQVRIEAADIQAAFEPSHIWSWQELLDRLDHASAKARQNAEFLGGVERRPRKRFDRILAVFRR